MDLVYQKYTFYRTPVLKCSACGAEYCHHFDTGRQNKETVNQNIPYFMLNNLLNYIIKELLMETKKQQKDDHLILWSMEISPLKCRPLKCL